MSLRDRDGNEIEIGDEVRLFRRSSNGKETPGRFFVRALKEDTSPRNRANVRIDDGDGDNPDYKTNGWTKLLWVESSALSVRLDPYGRARRFIRYAHQRAAREVLHDVKAVLVPGEEDDADVIVIQFERRYNGQKHCIKKDISAKELLAWHPGIHRVMVDEIVGQMISALGREEPSSRNVPHHSGD